VPPLAAPAGRHGPRNPSPPHPRTGRRAGADATAHAAETSAELEERAGELGLADGRAAARLLFFGKDTGFYQEARRGIAGHDPAALEAIGPRRGRPNGADLGLRPGDPVPPGALDAYLDSHQDAYWQEVKQAVYEHFEQARRAAREARSVRVIYENGLIPDGAEMDLDLVGLEPEGIVTRREIRWIEQWLAGNPGRTKVTWSPDPASPLRWAAAPSRKWAPSALRNEIFRQAGLRQPRLPTHSSWLHNGIDICTIANSIPRTTRDAPASAVRDQAGPAPRKHADREPPARSLPPEAEP
jgi:hypothetical protein